MLILGSKLIGTSIMGLQTGTKLAVVKSPIINPGNLQIMAYEVDGPLLVEKPSYLRIADVRELSGIGMIIDSNDEFFGANDVISIKKLLDINFKLIGIHVIDDNNHKLGKVLDYSIDTNSFIIQQLRVKQTMMKSITSTELLIHRSQIIEINNSSIIVKSTLKKVEQVINNTEKLTYINPFRSSTPQTNNKEN